MDNGDKDKTMLFPAMKEERAELYKKSEKRMPKSYIFYCCMTLSVMLLTIAFAATVLFAVFFSVVYPDKMILSKFFGSDAESGMSFQELMLNQSFGDLSFGKGEKETAAPTDTEKTPTTEEPKTDETEAPDEGTDTATEENITTREPDVTDEPTVTKPVPEDIYAPSGVNPPAGARFFQTAYR